MNMKSFNQLMKRGHLKQEPSEWKTFLDFCSIFLRNHKIKNPVVVELGILHDAQEAFWNQLFVAEHIGIDISDVRARPDILGDTHDPKTLKALKRKLNGRPINILFIDADHTYDAVKKDFEVYSPLCNDIIVLHDIETCRHGKRASVEVWKFWDELKLKAEQGDEELKDFMFITIFKKCQRGRQRGMGLIIKK